MARTICIALAAIFIFNNAVRAEQNSDLAIERRDIPPQQNAFFYLVQALEKCTYDSALKQGETLSLEELKQLLGPNAECIDLFDQAMACQEIQSPALEIKKLAPISIALRQVAVLQIARAATLQKQGDDAAALDELIKVVKLGHLLQRDRGVLLEFVLGTSIKALGLKQIKELVRVSALDSATLHSKGQEIEKYADTTDELADTFRMEYQHMSKLPAAEEVDDALGDLMLNYVRNANKPRTQCTPLRPNTKRTDILLLKRQFDHVVDTACKVAIQTKLTALLLNLKAYEKNTDGQLPDNLTDLIPKYIESVPVDNYNGKRLQYSKEKKMIYSAWQSDNQPAIEGAEPELMIELK